jgi:hypothetical protein
MFGAFAALGTLAIVGLFAGAAFPAAGASTKTAARPASAGPAATKTVAFSGQYSGKASLLIDNSTVTISSISGSGKNSLFGASKASGNGSAPKSSSSLCDPFGGKGSITGGANKITFVVTRSGSQQGCSSGESGAVTITFHGVAKASGGSGKGNGATGSLTFKGTLHLGGTSGAQSGNFTVSLTGKLTVKS